MTADNQTRVRNLQPCCPCLGGRPHSFTVKTLQRQPMTPYGIGATWDKTHIETIALGRFATKWSLERNMGFLLGGSSAVGVCCAQPGHVSQK